MGHSILWRIRYNSVSFIKNFIICEYYKLFKQKTFLMGGQTYRYFYHTFNRTWRTERTVEIPVIWEFMKKYQGKTILEVGNVLSGFFSINHDIVDKYEKAEKVINEDVVNFKPSKKYDLIVSISTLEHVGWDEELKEPDKILRAIENLKSFLANKGMIIVTMPLGYNSYLDKFIKEKKIEFTKIYFMKRITSDNKWIEARWEDVKDLKFNEPYIFANGLIIGIIDGGA